MTGYHHLKFEQKCTIPGARLPTTGVETNAKRAIGPLTIINWPLVLKWHATQLTIKTSRQPFTTPIYSLFYFCFCIWLYPTVWSPKREHWLRRLWLTPASTITCLWQLRQSWYWQGANRYLGAKALSIFHPSSPSCWRQGITTSDSTVFCVHDKNNSISYQRAMYPVMSMSCSGQKTATENALETSAGRVRGG